MATPPVAMTSKADLDDQRWLDQQVATLGDGIEAARDIWLNWTENRGVGRFHHGMTAGDFIAAQLGGVRLDLPRLIAALPDMSNVQLGKVAGVHDTTVMRARHAASANAEPDTEPVRVIGADGKKYPGRVVGSTTVEVIEPIPDPRPAHSEEPAEGEPNAPSPADLWQDLARTLDEIEALGKDALAIANSVPSRRITSTARRTRKASQAIAQIAFQLEFLARKPRTEAAQ